MGESLRKVSDHPARVGIVLLRQEPDIIAQVQKPFEDVPRLVVSTLERKIVGKPEGAEQECPLPFWQSVHVSSGDIAVDETVANQSSLNVVHCPSHSWICRRQEADERKHQQTGIRLLRPVILNERIDGWIETLAADILMDLRSEATPFGGIPLEPELFDTLDGSVHGDPRHDFRVGELPSGTADFPNALVGFVPIAFKEV
jgi:hypothetical protein